MDISQFFIKGDIRGAMEYMKGREEFKDILPFYVSLFEEEKYITYDIPEDLNAILLQYQIYYRDIFYLGLSEVEAAEKLLKQLQQSVKDFRLSVFPVLLLIHVK